MASHSSSSSTQPVLLGVAVSKSGSSFTLTCFWDLYFSFSEAVPGSGFSRGEEEEEEGKPIGRCVYVFLGDAVPCWSWLVWLAWVLLALISVLILGPACFDNRQDTSRKSLGRCLQCRDRNSISIEEDLTSRPNLTSAFL